MHLDQILLDMLTGLRVQRLGLAAAAASGLGALAFAVTHTWKHEIDVATDVAVIHAPVLIAPPRPAIPPAALDRVQQNSAPIAPADHLALVRALQRNLRERGCHDGPTNGIWTANWKAAMRRFADNVNARLPVDEPDGVMLALVLSRPDASCRAETMADAANVPPETGALPSPLAMPPAPQPQADQANGSAAAGAAGLAATALTAPSPARSVATISPDADAGQPIYRKSGPSEPTTRKPRRVAKQTQSYQSISKSLNKSFKSIQRSLASVFD